MPVEKRNHSFLRTQDGFNINRPNVGFSVAAESNSYVTTAATCLSLKLAPRTKPTTSRHSPKLASMNRNPPQPTSLKLAPQTETSYNRPLAEARIEKETHHKQLSRARRLSFMSRALARAIP